MIQFEKLVLTGWHMNGLKRKLIYPVMPPFDLHVTHDFPFPKTNQVHVILTAFLNFHSPVGLNELGYDLFGWAIVLPVLLVRKGFTHRLNVKMADGLFAELRGKLGINPFRDGSGFVPKKPRDLWHGNVLLSKPCGYRVS